MSTIGGVRSPPHYQIKMSNKYCVECNNHLGCKQYGSGIRFCCRECKDKFHKKYFSKSHQKSRGILPLRLQKKKEKNRDDWRLH